MEMNWRMKGKIIVSAFIVLFTMVGVYSQTTPYEFCFKHMDVHEFLLPPIPGDTTGYTSIYQLKRSIKDPRYTSQIDKVIDSCVVESDTLKVYFCLNDLVFLYDSVTQCHAFEYRAMANYKHNFSLVLPLCGDVPFEGNVVMLQSFCNQYFFKRIKKSKFQLIEWQYVDMEMEDALKLGLRIEYTSIRPTKKL